MIVVDASAICAIAFREAEGPAIKLALADADRAIISPINYWEAMVSITRREGEGARLIIEGFLASSEIRIASIGPDDAFAAFDAWRRFGKTRHRAELNLGDCFAYALAKSRDLPLLFKGDDFAMTDIRSAL